MKEEFGMEEVGDARGKIKVKLKKLMNESCLRESWKSILDMTLVYFLWVPIFFKKYQVQFLLYPSSEVQSLFVGP